ncbi:hypothetical protein AL755_17010 [Arthrobacter sp. ERGS1:01]|uniref:YbaK/EbsC family protein n=1 Tax=Arthrobacter sp. ERGS1:01 TaxID=1704044 RepID=UPI0006B64126|nr:YbaK/EbsC family protein [Arthrobacter sp. ERGS1:01]ALE06756.1 hypothetical protein AL755_17010 [Arthrobacter sp. ERGS1:01]
MQSEETLNGSALLASVQSAVATHGIVHEVMACPAELADTAEFCAHFGVSLEQSANTIVVTSKKVDPPHYAICVVLGTTRLDVNKKVKELLGVKRASFADADTTTALTGMEIGGVTAIGVRDLPIYIDSAVMEQTYVVMGGGNRTSKVRLDPRELAKLPGAAIVEGLANPKD